jgi:Glycerol-3-phosphate dehydrogenase
MTRVAVVGAGSWGTTFAKVLADAETDVTIWARRAELAKEISESRRNSDYLPGINLPTALHATASLAEAVAGAEAIYLAVPSQTLRENLADIAPVAEAGTVYVS